MDICYTGFKFHTPSKHVKANQEHAINYGYFGVPSFDIDSNFVVTMTLIV